jgi:gliding motility-associated lipoprotein GldH
MHPFATYRSSLLKATALAALFIVAGACSRSSIDYYEFKNLKNNCWERTDTLLFTIQDYRVKLNVPYKISIDLVNAGNYPYRNLWLYIQNDISYEDVFKKETIEYNLSDENGRWSGAGFGSLYQLPLVYKDTIIFRQERNYTFKILQAMSDDTLPGINKIGLRLERL